MAKCAIVNARLIDGTGEEPKDGWGLVIDGASIQTVEPAGSLRVPADAQVIDAAGLTLMPGLIDPHTHLSYHVSTYALNMREMTETLETNTIKATENARTILETGCTAIGDGACRGNIAVAIRDAVSQGLIPGPKVVAAGQMMCGSGGVVDHTYTWGYQENPAFFGTVVNSPQEVRTAVRKQMRQGVDMVKVSASGLPGDPYMDGRTQDLSFEELEAAVKEAAKFGKRVHAHAHDAEGLKAAVRAGVISLHSGEYVDDEGLELMKERGCVFVPTISWLHFRVSEEYAREFTRAFKLSDQEIKWFVDECRDAYETCREAIVKAFRVGAPTAVGSDGAHVFPPYDVVLEMEYFQELGIPPLQIINAATQVAAQAIGRRDVWGTLEPGKAADILVVDGDPSKNVSVLRDKSNIVMMFQDGRVVKDIRSQAAVNPNSS